MDLLSPDNQTLLISSSYRNNHPDISPDGSQLVFSSNRTGTQNIWLSEIDGSNQTQITFFDNKRKAGYAQWSPDGKQILIDFGGISPYVINVSGSKVQKLTLGDNSSWTLDGKGFYSSTLIPDLKLHQYSLQGNIPGG